MILAKLRTPSPSFRRSVGVLPHKSLMVTSGGSLDMNAFRTLLPSPSSAIPSGLLQRFQSSSLGISTDFLQAASLKRHSPLSLVLAGGKA